VALIKNYAIETKQRDFAASFRSDLAASFRWVGRLGFHEGVANPFSVAVPNSAIRKDRKATVAAIPTTVQATFGASSAVSTRG